MKFTNAILAFAMTATLIQAPVAALASAQRTPAPLAPAAVDSAQIQVQSKLIGKLMFGTTEYSLKGSTAKEMVTNLLTETISAEEDEFMFDMDSVSFDDETTVGTLTVKGARDLLSDALNYESHFQDIYGDLDKTKHEQVQAVVLNSFENLVKSGAAFGYTFSGGYCGVAFTGLLVIDVEAKKAYLITLAPTGSC